MKELESNNKLSEKRSIEIVAKKKQEVQYELDSTLKPISGHTLWEINKETLEIEKAKFINKKEVHLYDVEKVREEVLKVPGFAYISALNKENALERFRLGKGSAGIPTGHIQLKKYLI